jgi:hypothetical protein
MTSEIIEEENLNEKFVDENGVPFITLKVTDQYETWKIGSSNHRNLLLRREQESSGKILDERQLNSLVGSQKGEAILSGIQKKVHTRVAYDNTTLFYDLGGKDWKVLKVSAEASEVLENCPIKFKRSQSTSENVLPVKPGNIHLLRKYLNFESEEQYVLMLSSIIGAFHPTGPYVISVFQGGHGCSKSTVTKVFKSIVDPTSTPLRAPTGNEKDFFIYASSNLLVCFDNLSGVSNKMSDMMCRLSTGGSFSTRTLYTNDEETVFDEKKPLVLNGIDDIARREDLASRSVVFFLPPLEKTNRISEREFWQSFEKDKPYIMAGVFDCISCALKNYENVQLDEKVRMSDFLTWVCAASEALEFKQEFICRAFDENQIEIVKQSHENDPVAVALEAFLLGEDKKEFNGTATELMTELNCYYSAQYLNSNYRPQTPIAFANHIRRISEGFGRVTNYKIEFRREGGTGSRQICISLQNVPKEQLEVTEL